MKDNWDALDADLPPWRALGRPGSGGPGREALTAQVLAQVDGADPLADPGDTLADPGDTVTLAGDWHGDSGWAAQAISHAARAGSRLVLQLGDFGLWPGHRGEGYLDAVEAACRRENVTVCWLDGNHESFDGLSRYPVAPCGLRPVRPHVWHLPRGHRWTWHGQVWLAVGGAVSVDRSMRTPGLDWWWQETLKPDEARAVIEAGPADVMLTHDRPTMAAAACGQTPGSWHAIGLRNGWAREDLHASDEHAALLQSVVDAVQPSRLFHGHLHDRYDALIDATPWGRPCRVSGLNQQGDSSNLIHLRLPVA